jgi:putative endonuclease
VIGMRAKDSLGRFGEDLAAAHLEAAGMQLLERNWRCRQGEIDIVAVDAGCLVICEVKTRRSAAAGSPLEAVTPVKIGRLRRLTAAWLADHPQYFDEIRIDVVAIMRPPVGPLVLEHLRAVG